MPWGAIGGAAIGAVGSLIGGAINNHNANAQAALQYQHQKEFAQNGVRWKVADAQAAGIHPLAALGAQTFSYNPVAVGSSDGGVSEALGRMGQGISRAVQAKQLQEERDLNKALTQANIDKVKAETNFVNQQAAASSASVAKTALPPPMARANTPKQESPNVAAPVPKFKWVLNPDGKRELLPTGEFIEAYEDKPFGFDLIPLLEAGSRSLYGKLTDSPIGGRRWSWSALDWVPDTERVSKGSWSKRLKGTKAFYKNLNNY